MKNKGNIKDKIPVLIDRKTKLIVYLDKDKPYSIEELRQRYKIGVYIR